MFFVSCVLGEGDRIDIFFEFIVMELVFYEMLFIFVSGFDVYLMVFEESSYFLDKVLKLDSFIEILVMILSFIRFIKEVMIKWDFELFI